MRISKAQLYGALHNAGFNEMGTGLLDYLDSDGIFKFLMEPDFEGNFDTTHVLDDIAIWKPSLSSALRQELASALGVSPDDL